MSINRFRKLNVELICPYQPGKPIDEVKRALGLERVAKLASNENPLGPSPGVIQALNDTELLLNQYPDFNGYYLTKDLSEVLGVPPEEIILGNGSAGVMRLVSDAFLAPGHEAIIPDVSFPVFEMVTLIAGAKPVMVPVTGEMEIDLDALLAAVTDSTRVIWLANPNNPTGLYIPWEQVERFLERLPEHVMTVMDVAYSHYVRLDGYATGMERLRKRPRVIMLKTFSKAYGLAGLRCGVGVTRPHLVELMSKVRIPFCVNTPAQAAARIALRDREHVEKTVALNAAELERYYRAFDRWGLSYLRSHANFVLVDVGQDASEVAQRLLHEGVIVRSLPGERLKRMLRITTGMPEQSEMCIEALDGVLGGGRSTT